MSNGAPNLHKFIFFLRYIDVAPVNLMQRQQLVLLVQKDEVCIELLRYVDNNLKELARKCEIKVKSVATDKQTITRLREKGVTRLPTMICGGRPCVGLRNIMEILRKLIAPPRDPLAVRAVGDSHYDWLMREMFTPGEGGKIMPRTDDEVDESRTNKSDIESRMKRYTKSTPRSDDGYQDDEHEAARGRPADTPRGGNRQAPPRQELPPTDLADNIADMSHLVGGTPGDTLGGASFGGDYTDPKMLDAFASRLGFDS